MFDEGGDICIAKNNMLRFENLEADFTRYVNSKGLEFIELTVENKTKNRPDCRTAYGNADGSINQVMVDIVAEAYHDDFQLLGYPITIQKQIITPLQTVPEYLSQPFQE